MNKRARAVFGRLPRPVRSAVRRARAGGPIIDRRQALLTVMVPVVADMLAAPSAAPSADPGAAPAPANETVNQITRDDRGPITSADTAVTWDNVTETLQALAEQTYVRIEIIVVVAGESAAELVPQAEAAARGDNRAQVVSAGSAREVARAGLAAARGDAVIMIRPGQRPKPAELAREMRWWRRHGTPRLVTLLRYDVSRFFAAPPWRDTRADIAARELFAGLVDQVRPQLGAQVWADLPVRDRLNLLSFIAGDLEQCARTWQALKDFGRHVPTAVALDGTVYLARPDFPQPDTAQSDTAQPVPLPQREAAAKALGHVINDLWPATDATAAAAPGPESPDQPAEQPIMVTAPPLLRITTTELTAEHGINRIYVTNNNLHITGWAFLRHLNLADHATTISVYLRPKHGAGQQQHFRVRAGSEQVSRLVHSRWPDYDSAAFHAVLPLDELTEGQTSWRSFNRTWTLRIAIETAGHHAEFSARNIVPHSGAAQRKAAKTPLPGHRLTWRRGQGDRLELTVAPKRRGPARNPLAALAPPPQVRIVSLTVDEAELQLAGKITSAETRSYQLLLANGPHQTSASFTANSSGDFTAVLPLTVRRFGQTVALPYGDYQLTARAGGSAVPVRAVDDFAARVPLDVRGATHRVAVSANVSKTPAKNKTLRLNLSTPLESRTVGSLGQARLQRRYTAAELAPLKNAVLFHAYVGEAATDSALAIHRELRRRHPELQLYWSVANPLTPLPEGGLPLLIGSKEWFEVLCRAEYLVNNVFFPRWWRKRSFQTYVQTWHGTPLKRIGASYWIGKGHSPAWLEGFFAQAASWDYLLSPSPYATDIYRSEFRFSGEIVELGSPRNDLLINYDVSLRREIAEKVGVDPAKKIVMYAPTWRDRLSRRAWFAPMVDFLDAHRLAAELGSEFVVMVRGHGHNARSGAGLSGYTEQVSERVINVTYYPDITELSVLADVVVTDYSSLMFDVAAAAKPLVFLVPDLAEYAGAERGLYVDYRETVPGPVLTSPAGLAAAIGEIAAESWEPDAKYREFIRRFAPHDDGAAAARIVDRIWPTVGAADS